MIDTIARSYVTAGRANQALVIPVGYAFELSYATRPELSLHKTFDGTHPSLYGTYLAACVVYLSVYGDNLDGLSYDYFGEIYPYISGGVRCGPVVVVVVVVMTIGSP